MLEGNSEISVKFRRENKYLQRYKLNEIFIYQGRSFPERVMSIFWNQTSKG